MSTNDGGPAFPTLFDAKDYPGMSLRDWFASQEKTTPSLSHIPVLTSGLWGVRMTDLSVDEAAKVFAVWRYKCADAMLAEREKQDA